MHDCVQCYLPESTTVQILHATTYRGDQSENCAAAAILSEWQPRSTGHNKAEAKVKRERSLVT